MKRLFTHFSLIPLIVLFSNTVLAQTGPVGARVYTDSDARAAAKEINRQLESEPDNPKLWNALALELQYLDKKKDAVEAFEKAVELEPSNTVYFLNYSFAAANEVNPRKTTKSATKRIEEDPSDARSYFDRALASYNAGNFEPAMADVDFALLYDPKLNIAYALKSEIYLRRYTKTVSDQSAGDSVSHIKDSIGVLEKCVRECGLKNKNVEFEILDRQELVSILEDPESISGKNPPEAEGMKLHTKPRPGYTNTARRLLVKGSVTLTVTFKSDGTIGPILVREGLPTGLTASAIKAAQGIGFEPIKIDGKPVSAVKTVVMNFEIY